MAIVAFIIGVFYVFAGYVVLRSMAIERVMDRSFSALGSPSGPKDRFKRVWLTVGGILTFGGGVSLVLLSHVAPVLFLASLILQIGFLIWAAMELPPRNGLERKNRKQSSNAVYYYGTAAIFAMWAALNGTLRPLPQIGVFPAIATDLLLISVATLAIALFFLIPSRGVPLNDAEDWPAEPEGKKSAEDAVIGTSAEAVARIRRE